jgi:hypothetical protein
MMTAVLQYITNLMLLLHTLFVTEHGGDASDLIFANFEKDTGVKNWGDPFDSIWLKMISVVVYTIEVMASMVMFMFVRYETQGLAGHYRTIINQFLSYLYGVVSLSF